MAYKKCNIESNKPTINKYVFYKLHGSMDTIRAAWLMFTEFLIEHVSDHTSGLLKSDPWTPRLPRNMLLQEPKIMAVV